MVLKAFQAWFMLCISLACLVCLGPKKPKQKLFPKREFRGVWIATFANLDWPSQKGLSPLVQQAEFEDLLDQLAATDFNAVIVQVRPSADAFYNSRYEPWSEFLSGKQGVDPGYDPLAFMIEAAHARNIDFHAWVNPFRGVSHIRFSSLTADHVANRYPHWFFTYGNTMFFNPGLPEVRDYLSCVILDIAQRYDVDGIHFDDYFYPYPKPSLRINDLATYAWYGRQDADLASWRRENIDMFIQQVHDSLQKYTPSVKFGISPPAVWRNHREDPLGSKTQADLTAYDHLFANSRRWLQQGWVDYLSPQCYHHHRYKKARFPNLASWWNENAAGRHVYLGHAAYKVQEGKWPAWRRRKELPNQLWLGRELDHIYGSILYRGGSLDGNPQQLQSQLASSLFKQPAIVPTMPWKDNIPPNAPQALQIISNQLKWEPGDIAVDQELARQYVVYHFPSKISKDLNRPEYIVTITSETSYSTEALKLKQGTWAVTALDKLANESSAATLETGP